MTIAASSPGMGQWAWDPDDFAVLWRAQVGDWMPSLLRYTSRFRSGDQAAAHRFAVRRGCGADELDRIGYALSAVTSSLLRLEIFGGTSTDERWPGQNVDYRIVGAYAPECAAVLHQFTHGDTDGLIRLQTCAPEDLPTRLAATIPACEAGAGPVLSVHADDVKNGRPSPHGHAPHERYRQWRAGAIDGGGTAVLRTGAFNVNEQPWYQLVWFDLPDGRYVEERAAYVTVRPVSVPQLATRFGGWIDRALTTLRNHPSTNR